MCLRRVKRLIDLLVECLPFDRTGVVEKGCLISRGLRHLVNRERREGGFDLYSGGRGGRGGSKTQTLSVVITQQDTYSKLLSRA